MGILSEEFGVPSAPTAGAPAAAPQAPAPTAPVAPGGEEPSLLGRIANDVGTGLTEAIPAVGSGIARAANEVSQAAYELGSWANDKLDLGTVEIGKDGVRWRPGMPDKNELKIPDSVMPPRPTSVTGSGVEGISQFLTGYVLGGKLLKGAGFTAARLAPSLIPGAVAASETVAGQLAYAGTRSMFSGAAAFDPAEARLSNLINEDTPFGNFATEYLASQPGDSKAEGRFKNALENLALDIPAEGLFYALKGIKLKRAGDLKGAQDAADQAEKAMVKPTPEASTGAPGEPTAAPKGTETASADGAAVTQRAPRKARNDYDPDPEVLVKGADGVDKVEPYKAPFEFTQKQTDYLYDSYSKIADDQVVLDQVAEKHLWTNMSRVADENDAKAFANKLGEIGYQAFVKARGGRVTLQDVEKLGAKMADDLADYTGADVRSMVLKMNGDKQGLDHLVQNLIGYREMTAQYSRRSTDLANAMRRGDLSEFNGDHAAWRKEFLSTVQTLYSIAPVTEGIKSGLGRNLSLLRASAGPDGKAVGKLAGVTDEAAAASKAATPEAQVAAAKQAQVTKELQDALAGDQRSIDALVEKLARVDNPKSARQVVDAAFDKGTPMGVNNELWINSLLSGPKTHVVNMVTSALKSAVIMPGEQVIAGLLTADKARFMMGADTFAGLFMSMKESMKQAGKAFKFGDAILDKGAQGMGESQHAIVPQTFGLNTETPLGMLVSGFGNLVRMPGRLLTTEDEFLKTANYRARLYAMGYREGREMRRVNGASDFEIGQFVNDYVNKGFDANGAAVNAEALSYARDATFTNSLKAETWSGRKSFGEDLNSLAANHPGMRLIMPFTRVPTNIMRDAWDHTPGMNLLRKQYRAELEAGGDRAAMASAKMATGGAIWTTAVMMAVNGDIVGNLSSDPTVRRAQQEAKIIPNSFKHTDPDTGETTYYEFNRFDPYATFFSTVATFADIARHTDDWKLDDLAGAVVTATAKNIESKTYLQGLTEIMGAISDPDKRGMKFLQKRVASYVPSITNEFRGADYLSDPHNFAQAMKARTSRVDEVDPRYNLIGERVGMPEAFGPDHLSPIAMGKPDDPTLLELARLSQVHNGGLGYPSKTKSDGIDTTQFKIGDQTAYGRLQELTGTVKQSGRTLRENLQTLFDGDKYKSQLVDGQPGSPGSRLTQVQAMIEQHRQAAYGQLQKENPEFRAAVQSADRHKLEIERFGPRK